MRYRYIWHKKPGSQSQWRFWEDHEVVHIQALSSNKRARPMLGLCSSGTDHFILSADFDQIPVHTSMNFSTVQQEERYWKYFYEECKERYGHQAAITRSYSNKVKIFIPFQLPERYSKDLNDLSRYTKESILKSFLHEDHHWFDTNVAGMDVAFLNPTAINFLSTIHQYTPVSLFTEDQSLLYKDIPSSLFVPNEKFVLKRDLKKRSETKKHKQYGLFICKVDDSDEIDQISNQDHEINNVIKPDFYRYNQRFLPKGLLESKILCLKGGEEVMRRLLLIKNLNSSRGFGLPTHKLSRECEVSVPQVSKLLKILSEEGNLDCIDSRSVYGKRARIYRAAGNLRKEIHLQFEKTSDGRSKSLYLPEKILDGQWEKTLYAIAYHFPKKEDYEEYVLNLDGIEEKDRMQKLKRILRKWDSLDGKNFNV